MSEIPRLCHFVIVDGNDEEIRILTEHLKIIKEKLPNLEFLVTNDKIRLYDVKFLIDELFKLYKSYKKTQEQILEGDKSGK